VDRRNLVDRAAIEFLFVAGLCRRRLHFGRRRAATGGPSADTLQIGIPLRFRLGFRALSSPGDRADHAPGHDRAFHYAV